MSANGSHEEVVVGVVGRPWGLRGQFHLDARLEDPAILLAEGAVRIRRRGAHATECAIRATHQAGGRLIVALEGCNSVEDAEALKGAEVLLGKGAFLPAPVGSFYPHQLEGLQVVGVDGTPYGSVKEIVRTGGPELLLVGGAGKDFLVPFAEAICRRVDMDAGVIEIDPPEGLMDLD